MGEDGLTFLHDVVVLDLGDEATALAGEYLAELGATVVRVEDERGDVLRRRGGHWHAVHNAGKRSVAIDTTSDAAWDADRRRPARHRRRDRAARAEPGDGPVPRARCARSTAAASAFVDVVFRRDAAGASRSPT